MTAEDMTNPKVDELSVMTYISFFRDYENKPKPKSMLLRKICLHTKALSTQKRDTHTLLRL